MFRKLVQFRRYSTRLGTAVFRRLLGAVSPITQRVGWLDRLAARCACGVVAGYQRFVSPYKGFDCAQATLNRNLPSCSAKARLLFSELPLSQAILGLDEQFRCCAQAARTLRARPAAGRLGGLASLPVQAMASDDRRKGGMFDDLPQQMAEEGLDAGAEYVTQSYCSDSDKSSSSASDSSGCDMGCDGDSASSAGGSMDCGDGCSN